MEYNGRYIRGIKRNADGKPTAHEIRIHITDPIEQSFLGQKSLTRFLASGGDYDKAIYLAQEHMPALLARKQEAEKAAGKTITNGSSTPRIFCFADLLNLVEEKSKPLNIRPALRIKLSGRYRPHRRYQENKIALNKLEQFIGHNIVKNVTSDEINAYLKSLFGSKSEKHIDSTISDLKRMFKIAKEHGKIHNNPVDITLGGIVGDAGYIYILSNVRHHSDRYMIGKEIKPNSRFHAHNKGAGGELKLEYRYYTKNRSLVEAAVLEFYKGKGMLSKNKHTFQEWIYAPLDDIVSTITEAIQVSDHDNKD